MHANISINDRYIAEQKYSDTWVVTDLYRNADIGRLWQFQANVWGFALDNGRERMGPLNGVLGSLRRMLPVKE